MSSEAIGEQYVKKISLSTGRYWHTVLDCDVDDADAVDVSVAEVVAVIVAEVAVTVEAEVKQGTQKVRFGNDYLIQLLLTCLVE